MATITLSYAVHCRTERLQSNSSDIGRSFRSEQQLRIRSINGASSPELSEKNLEWAVLVSGDGEMSPAVAQLLDELSARGIAIHDSRSGAW